MKGKMPILVSLIFLLAFSIAGCGKEKETVSEESLPVAVEVEKVKLTDIADTIVVNGIISPKQDVSVSPKTAGKVSGVYAKVGEPVKKGDLLLQLETTELQVQLRQAQASLELAKANLAKMQVSFQNANLNLERMKKLYEEGAVSLTQYETAQLQVNTSLQDIKALQSQIAQMEANVDLIRTQLSNASVVSPISGIVAAVNVDAGEMVSPSLPVVSVVDTSTVLVKVKIAESEINFVKTGVPVKIRVDALDKEFTGRVSSVSPVADQTKTFPVEIAIDNPEGELKGGMFAEAQFEKNRKEKVLVIPLSAVVQKGDACYVYIVENNIAKQRQIELGVRNNTHAEVISGLAEGETIVTVGQNLLENGTKVAVRSRGEQ